MLSGKSGSNSEALEADGLLFQTSYAGVPLHFESATNRSKYLLVNRASARWFRDYGTVLP